MNSPSKKVVLTILVALIASAAVSAYAADSKPQIAVSAQAGK